MFLMKVQLIKFNLNCKLYNVEMTNKILIIKKKKSSLAYFIMIIVLM
jgi:hypothetical protein